MTNIDHSNNDERQRLPEDSRDHDRRQGYDRGRASDQGARRKREAGVPLGSREAWYVQIDLKCKKIF